MLLLRRKHPSDDAALLRRAPELAVRVDEPRDGLGRELDYRRQGDRQELAVEALQLCFLSARGGAAAPSGPLGQAQLQRGRPRRRDCCQRDQRRAHCSCNCAAVRLRQRRLVLLRAGQSALASKREWCFAEVVCATSYARLREVGEQEAEGPVNC